MTEIYKKEELKREPLSFRQKTGLVMLMAVAVFGGIESMKVIIEDAQEHERQLDEMCGEDRELCVRTEYSNFSPFGGGAIVDGGVSYATFTPAPADSNGEDR